MTGEAAMREYEKMNEKGMKEKKAITGLSNSRKECLKQERAKRETKRRIVDAFWELYKTTSIEKITVKKITDACGIYRTTFYLHFADVYAILEEIEAQLMEELKKITCELADTEQDRRILVRDIQTSFMKNYEYLRVLLDGRHHPDFTKDYKTELMKRLCAVCHIDGEALNTKSQKIVGTTFFVMIDLMLSLAENPDLNFEDVVVILEGYMNRGIVNTLSDVYKNC